MSEKILIIPNEETMDLLPGYLERRKTELTTLDAALAGQDFRQLATVGHNVKGTAGSYGIPVLGELAEALHTGAVAQNEEGCRQALAAYRSYLLRLEVGDPA